MRLGWDEIRRRAKSFSEEWKAAHYEKGETQTFYNEFFEIFGIKRRQVAIYEQRVKLLNNRHGFIDLFWPGMLLIEQKSSRLDLGKAQGQALDYVEGIHPTQQPRWVLTCDFQNWVLLDLETGTELKFRLADLPKHITVFDFMLGRRVTFQTQAAVTIKAAELMGALHDALASTGYVGHDLEQLLVRLLFCMFADTTGIFQPLNIFLQLIENDTRPDGSDVGRVLADLFDVLDTPEDKRQTTLQAELKEFPYVNGRLFHDPLRAVHFTKEMREMLLDACRHDWSAVSPAIFGSLFQSVMNAKERRAKGAHYTSEENILKVIGPLFLDDLRTEFAAIIARKTGRARALAQFQEKLASLTFLDPACGCGNFLVIAYREIRRLELDCLKTQHGDQRIDAALLSRVTVEQFFGIEYEEFPAKIAEVAMWMMDHIANSEINAAFRSNYARIPLRESPHILHGDALDTDWAALLPPVRCSYVMGNPPFVGAKYQTDAQRAQVRRVANLGGSGGTLDYVAAWFLKAGQYLQENRTIRIGFVATNSITQGEQVAQLWPVLFDRYGLEIIFAHRTFSWQSEARGKAHVHVVIVGLAHRDHEPTEKRLFSYPDIKGSPVETRHGALTAYLFDAQGVANRHLVVKEEAKPLNGAHGVVIGSKPVDGRFYILDNEERTAFLEREPQAATFLHPYVGAEEFINGGTRWILHLADASPTELRGMPLVRERIAKVRAFREASKSAGTRDLAQTPTRYHVTVVPDRPFLVIPKVSSERREYIPIGWLQPPVIPSDLMFVQPGATLFDFAVLTSRAHMAWLSQIGGRLESRYRYSISLVYNTYPRPDATPSQRSVISALAQSVLDARAKYPTSSFADLYDPDTMPGDLRRAHAALDKAVDRLYRTSPFGSDRERVEHLFGRYEAMVNPLGRAARVRPRASGSGRPSTARPRVESAATASGSR
jgi:hypothetical protein